MKLCEKLSLVAEKHSRKAAKLCRQMTGDESIIGLIKRLNDAKIDDSVIERITGMTAKDAA